MGNRKSKVQGGKSGKQRRERMEQGSRSESGEQFGQRKRQVGATAVVVVVG